MKKYIISFVIIFSCILSPSFISGENKGYLDGLWIDENRKLLMDLKTSSGITKFEIYNKTENEWKHWSSFESKFKKDRGMGKGTFKYDETNLKEPIKFECVLTKRKLILYWDINGVGQATGFERVNYSDSR